MKKQIVVIKLGGSSLQNSETLRELAILVRGYQKRRYNVVIVHGGGPAINQELTARSIEWKFINGQRQTTPLMMEVIEQVLSYDVNAMVVKNLQQAQVLAFSLSGASDNILICSQANKELMQVGKIESVNTKAIEDLFTPFSRQVPVIAPIGIGTVGEKFNVNADWAATHIAIGLHAKKLIFLTDQDGILDHNRRLVERANPELINNMIEAGIISGGMCTKVKAMVTALENGIKKVRVIHASSAGTLLYNDKIGTLLTNVQLTNIQNKREVSHGQAS